MGDGDTGGAASDYSGLIGALLFLGAVAWGGYYAVAELAIPRFNRWDCETKYEALMRKAFPLGDVRSERCDLDAAAGKQDICFMSALNQADGVRKTVPVTIECDHVERDAKQYAKALFGHSP